ncbi:MAG: hypothetical protein P4L98_10540 [Ancalomicrobiaceae bacterium]|nr:hypothetical protein [Ancalomicrobiaceae bacterium]
MTEATATIDTAHTFAAPTAAKAGATTFMWALVLSILVAFTAAAAIFGYAGVIVMAVGGAFAMLATLVVITMTGL